MSDEQPDEREAAEALALAEALEEQSNSGEQASQSQSAQAPEDALQSAALLRYVREGELGEERLASVLENLADVPIPPAPESGGARILRPRFRRLAGISSVAVAAAALLMTWRLQTHEALDQVARTATPSAATTPQSPNAPQTSALAEKAAPADEEEMTASKETEEASAMERPVPKKAVPMRASRARAPAKPMRRASAARARSTASAKPSGNGRAVLSPFETNNLEQAAAYAKQLSSLNDALVVALSTARVVASPASTPVPAKSTQAQQPAREAEAPGTDTPLSEELEHDHAASTSGCDQAPALRDRICKLAKQICGIAEVHPNDHDVQVKCDDGQRACEHARSIVSEACE